MERIEGEGLYAKWRIAPVAVVAKLFGVLVHIEGFPHGSNRLYLADRKKRPPLVNGGVGHSAACASTGPAETCGCRTVTRAVES